MIGMRKHALSSLVMTHEPSAVRDINFHRNIWNATMYYVIIGMRKHALSSIVVNFVLVTGFHRNFYFHRNIWDTDLC